jgi:poly-gamma-glutamate capsule biosynthesis protein CapA/YwtB (metallophosphatase superfamily)
VANHEGPITSRSEPAPKLDTGRKRYWYRAVPTSISALLGAGIRVVSLGNNHVLDFGPQGLADTVAALDEAGIAHCGAGATRADARRPTIVKVGSLRFGFLSFMQRYKARTDFARLAERADVRIALAHWGRNYRKVNGRQRRLASGLAEVGADLVIGHHPHVPHPISLVDGVPVCFSLGNGALGTPGRFHGGRPPYGLVVSFDFDETAVIRRITVGAIFVDNAQVNFHPQIAERSEARDLLTKLFCPVCGAPVRCPCCTAWLRSSRSEHGGPTRMHWPLSDIMSK